MPSRRRLSLGLRKASRPTLARRAGLWLRSGRSALPRLQRHRSSTNAAWFQGRRRQEWLAALSWEQLFFDPIELPDGRTLRSLRDAGEFIQSLPVAVQDRSEWRTATEALLLVVRWNGDPMFARIGIMRALNIGKPLGPEPRRKPVKRYRVL